MKVTYCVVVLFVALAVSYGYPATKTEEKEPQPDKEVDFVPLGERRTAGAQFPPGVVDVDAGGFFGSPFAGNPFPSLLGSIEALMARMRQQLSQILGRLPDKPGDTAFPELHIPNLGDIDLGKGNTTSVTKVIDGHKVTINETEYKQDGDDGAAFFKVRIIDVHPDSSEEVSGEKDAEPVIPSKRDRESTEDTINNEIPKTKDNEELNFDNIETFDEADLVPPHKYANIRRNIDWGNLRSVENIEDNSIDAAPQPIRDLSNDIYINQLMADRGAATNPDAEVFEVLDGRLSSQYYPHAQSEKIISLNAPSQSVKIQTNFPVSDFERVGIQQEPMPVYSGNMPFHAPPTFSINDQRYSLPVEHMMPFRNNPFFIQPFQQMKTSQMKNSFFNQPNMLVQSQSFPEEEIIIQPNLPTLTKQQGSSTENNNNQQGATTSKGVLEKSNPNDNQKANLNLQYSKSSSENVTDKQTVSLSVEKQESSSVSKTQEVPQVPST